MLEKHPRCLGLGIDEETAVVVCGHTFTVLGKADVSICLPPVEGDEGNVRSSSPARTALLQLSHRALARLKCRPGQANGFQDDPGYGPVIFSRE